MRAFGVGLEEFGIERQRVSSGFAKTFGESENRSLPARVLWERSTGLCVDFRGVRPMLAFCVPLCEHQVGLFRGSTLGKPFAEIRKHGLCPLQIFVSQSDTTDFQPGLRFTFGRTHRFKSG